MIKINNFKINQNEIFVLDKNKLNNVRYYKNYFIIIFLIKICIF